jgi:hypothetical protein
LASDLRWRRFARAATLSKQTQVQTTRFRSKRLYIQSQHAAEPDPGDRRHGGKPTGLQPVRNSALSSSKTRCPTTRKSTRAPWNVRKGYPPIGRRHRKAPRRPAWVAAQTSQALFLPENPWPKEAISSLWNKAPPRRSGAPPVRSSRKWAVFIVRMWLVPRFFRPTHPATLECGIMQSIRWPRSGYGS